MKDPAEPADEATVNLLPSELVKKYDKERLKSQIWSLTLMGTQQITSTKQTEWQERYDQL